MQRIAAVSGIGAPSVGVVPVVTAVGGGGNALAAAGPRRDGLQQRGAALIKHRADSLVNHFRRVVRLRAADDGGEEAKKTRVREVVNIEPLEARG